MGTELISQFALSLQSWQELFPTVLKTVKDFVHINDGLDLRFIPDYLFFPYGNGR